MNDDFAGRGDPVKVLELLWQLDGAPKKRGPKPKVELADLVHAAIAIADAEGIDAVSTRRVADAVGISAMSFYTHIPGKAELLDLMVDMVAGLEMEALPEFTPAAWRDNLTVVASELRLFYLKHPWVIQLSTHRPVLGPNTMTAYEAGLRALDGLGLDEIEMDIAFTVVANYVFGAVRDEARARLVNEQTGMTDEQWWYTISPFLERIDYSPYPVASRVGPVAGEAYGLGDPERAFRFGLDLLLDGLAAFIERKAQVPSKATL